MRLRFFAFTACAVLSFVAGPAMAFDFGQLDRRIAKESTYQTRSLYGLALIGPDATTRVWMVLDGERLYVDKNANGDLTDDGPPAELAAKNTDPASFPSTDVSADGGRTVYKFEVTLWNRSSFRRGAAPDAEPFNQSVHVTFPDGRYYGAWGDHLKPLVFAAQPQGAPALHFGGSLRMGFEVRRPLERVAGGFKLSACVGTPGSCPGAWVHLLYRTIPKDVHPKAVLEFPPADPGGAPVRVEFVLGQRC